MFRLLKIVLPLTSYEVKTQKTYMTWADYLFSVKLFSALGCGLVAGIFFTFSTLVMRALAQLKPDRGIAAMQAINITVINPWFITAFLGTGLACIFLAIASLLKWHLLLNIFSNQK